MYDFGPLAAQDDTNLLKYFHQTRQVQALLSNVKKPTNCIFVARPGGGKTALVKWLEAQQTRRRVILMRPEENQLVAPDDDFNLEDNRILIQVELYTGVISELIKRGWLSNDLQTKCNDYIKKEWAKSINTFFKEKFEGLSILGCGFTLKASDRRNYLGVIKRTKKLSKVSQLMELVSKKMKLIVVSDDPEAMVTKGLHEVSRDNAIRNGAYLSVMTHLHALGCHVLLFVKEHVLQSVLGYYTDSSHFEDRIEGIKWTQEDLMDLLNLRLSKRLGKKWEEVFSLNQNTFCKKVLPFLINGPRDLLFICNNAGKINKTIKGESINRIIETLRNNKWNEIKKQFGVQWPKISKFAQSVIEILVEEHRTKTISRDKFKLTFEEAFENPQTKLHELRSKEDWINFCRYGSPNVNEILFFIGCLGYTFQGRKVYPWEGRSLEQFRTSSSIFISPLFSKT
jgi:hypothetical protein